ncbi:hypothetical protein [Candidatus Ichthyocystis hellenicum]|uniref:hypothetical protein n=1 Tax=Candidatus Ichthyocystis hellenicum TaxID=1561003 RepID=UPI000B8083A8|nr:hypothetical protein [Candidatus Ichthyocystis hellenicum]
MSVSLSPMTLEELAIGAVFGVTRKKSIEQLMHLSHKETIEIIVSLNSNSGGRTKYESVLDCDISRLAEIHQSNGNFFRDNCKNLGNYSELMCISSLKHHIHKMTNECDNLSKSLLPGSKYKDTHPICQVIYTKKTTDIVENYYKRKTEILSLPLPPVGKLRPKLPSLEETLYYYDPLFFLDISHYYGDTYQYMELFIEVITTPIIESYSAVNFHLRQLIRKLKRWSGRIRKQIYHLVMALSLQIKPYASLFPKLAKRRLLAETNIARAGNIPSPSRRDPRNERLILTSLDAIICLRNLIEYTHMLKKIIEPILEQSNYVSLEDTIKAFNNKIMRLCNNIKAIKEMDHKKTSLFAEEIEKREHAISLSKIKIGEINSFLKMRYPHLITHRKFVIGYLLEKITPNDSTDELIRELTNEIKEMGQFLLKLESNED